MSAGRIDPKMFAERCECVFLYTVHALSSHGQCIYRSISEKLHLVPFRFLYQKTTVEIHIVAHDRITANKCGQLFQCCTYGFPFPFQHFLGYPGQLRDR